jgi:uncharacterized protein (DUF1697 family)
MALTTQIALLRAINVDGRGKVAMADLRQMLTGLGFEDVRSLLQTGNIVFRSEPTGAKLEALLEREAAAKLDLKTEFLVRTPAQWREMIAANPFEAMAEDDPSHLVAMPLKSLPHAADLAALRDWIPGRETIEAVGHTLFLTYPDGIGDSELSGAVIERRLKVRGTARNWNTVTKIAAAVS